MLELGTVSMDVARTLQVGVVRLNLLEFTRLIRCAIVNDNYLFLLRLFIMSLSNIPWLFTSGKGKKVSMPIENFQRTRHSVAYSICCRAHHVWARKIFQKRSFQAAGKRYFELGFCK